MTLEWGYNKSNGPEIWPEYFTEARGHRQSPIDIQSVNIKNLITNKKLTWRYIAENTESITNPGYCWKVHVDRKGSELSGGPLDGKYVLEQFHCHWGETDNQGSEHTIDGKKYAGELHLVHFNKSKYRTINEAAKHPDGLCVLGVLLKLGKKHHEMEKVVSYLSKIEYKDQSTPISEPINPAFFIPCYSGYYTYQGSLTTPPCSECVVWVVFKEPIEVSHEQLTAFRNLKSYPLQCKTIPCDEHNGYVRKNFRPTFPLGQRVIRESRQ